MRKTITIMSLGLSLIIICAALASASDLAGKISVKGLRSSENILVYLTKTPDNAKPGKEFVLDQNNLTFSPYMLPIPLGSTISFPNNDKVDHNVFSLSRTNTFNLGSYKPGETRTVTFDKPGMVELRCDVHAEMISYIFVMKNSYYALTDKNGTFNIDTGELTPGKYYLKTWHKKLKSTRQAIEIQSDGSPDVIINLKRGAPSVLYK